MDIKNSEHYNDPTPHSAWKNICKEEQAEAARMESHRYSGIGHKADGRPCRV